MDHKVFVAFFIFVDFDEMVTTAEGAEAGKFVIKVNRSVEFA